MDKDISRPASICLCDVIMCTAPEAAEPTVDGHGQIFIQVADILVQAARPTRPSFRAVPRAVCVPVQRLALARAAKCARSPDIEHVSVRQGERVAPARCNESHSAPPRYCPQSQHRLWVRRV